ncbi:uncharacterized protein LOC130411602 [Triplophysa dalaica]|uniref:uncharacterized protein LOC130411602 n=1 Tax=Triplophysa dalaica TaxID=1582913 RepID=UPI0024E02EAB|nr:uncharacterized protein LOC130411602 [Triplophysa dalaica]
MDISRVTLAVLLYVVLLRERRIYGAEIEVKVRPGDNITLYCDRPLTHGSVIVWIRNCSHEHQPSLTIDFQKSYQETLGHFTLPKNTNINSFDLHITNITASDLGLYYCAEYEKKINKDENGIIRSSDVYNYGNQTTRLSFAVTTCSGPSSTVSPPPASDCFLCWTLLFSVCPVCVLFCLICVYCLCQKKTTDGGTDLKEHKGRNSPEGDDDEVCYASLEVTTRRQKRLKRKQPQCSDFSTYAPIRTHTVQNF